MKNCENNHYSNKIATIFLPLFSTLMSMLSSPSLLMLLPNLPLHTYYIRAEACLRAMH